MTIDWSGICGRERETVFVCVCVFVTQHGINKKKKSYATTPTSPRTRWLVWVEFGNFLFFIFVAKILTEVSKAPPKAVALASYLGDGYSAIGRTQPAKNLMAFGSVLQHTQHNIGMSTWSCQSSRVNQILNSRNWNLAAQKNIINTLTHTHGCACHNIAAVCHPLLCAQCFIIWHCW